MIRALLPTKRLQHKLCVIGIGRISFARSPEPVSWGIVGISLRKIESMTSWRRGSIWPRRSGRPEDLPKPKKPRSQAYHRDRISTPPCFAVLIHSMAVGYFCASARIKFDDEQFAALFNVLQARGDKGKLRQLFGS